MSRLEGAINGLKIAKETFFLDDVKVRNPGQKYEELT